MFDTLQDRTAFRWALILWLALAAAVCVKAGVRPGENTVYPVFAAAARHWWADMPLYADYQQSEGIDGYRYSPAFAVAFTPLAVLPDRLGAALWGLVSIGMLFWSLRVLVRDVLPGDWTPSREAAFLTLALIGSAVGIWSGQSNAIVPALVALALAAIVRGRWWAAAWLLAIPVFIKLWPLAIVLLLVACWPRQLIGRFAAACAALAAAPFLTRPFDKVVWQYSEWYASITGPLQGRWGGYRDAWTVWENLCPASSGLADWNQAENRHVYMALQLASAAAVLGWCLWQRRRLASTGHLLALIYAMWASWQLFLGPGTEQLTYGLIAPATSWAVVVSFAERRARWLTVAAWAMLALLAAGDIEKTALAVFPAGKMLLPLGVTLFVAWLVWHERGEGRPAEPQMRTSS